MVPVLEAKQAHHLALRLAQGVGRSQEDGVHLLPVGRVQEARDEAVVDRGGPVLAHRDEPSLLPGVPEGASLGPLHDHPEAHG